MDSFESTVRTSFEDIAQFLDTLEAAHPSPCSSNSCPLCGLLAANDRTRGQAS